MAKDLFTRLLERYGERMVLKEVCETLKMSPYLVSKIPIDDLPRTNNGGRRHATTHFLTQDVATYMVMSTRGVQRKAMQQPEGELELRAA